MSLADGSALENENRGMTIKLNNGWYQTCACEWRDGKVVSFCGAHQIAADDRVNPNLPCGHNKENMVWIWTDPIVRCGICKRSV